MSKSFFSTNKISFTFLIFSYNADNIVACSQHEATKSEVDEKIKNVEADVAKAQGPLESEEIFDDPDRWNNYNY